MLNSKSKWAVRPSVRFAQSAGQTRAICVVDPQAADYHGWEALVRANGGQLHLVATAEEALRVARTTAIDLWVVNIELPGLSGDELCGMLRGRSRSPIYLVADKYSAAVEQAAWQARPTLFGCKGAHHQWLDHWLAASRPRPHIGSPLSASSCARVVR